MWIDDDDDDEVPNTNNGATSAETPVPISPAPEVIYKVERPFLKVGLWFSGIFVTVCVALFIVGWVMGASGLRPPTIDNGVIQQQWEKMSGNETTEEPPSELEKVESTFSHQPSDAQ